MILVTGATGTVGREVTAQLLAMGQPVRVLTRNPQKAAKCASNVEIAQGDLEHPETLTAAFAGVHKVFLLAQGMPHEVVEAILELMALIRGGYGGKTTPIVEEVLGRKARTFDEWLQDHVDAFR